MIYPHNAILFGNERNEVVTQAETWMQLRFCAQWEEPVKKGHVLYELIYMKCPEQAESRLIVNP